MSVTNYMPNKCRYLITQLEEIVYLVSEDALKDIKIDNGSAYVSTITNDTPLSIKCYNLKLAESDALDERYKFTHTVTFSVKGYMNKDNFNGKYYVILKDKEGTYWLANPLFPSKVTYTYTLGDMQNHTDFTLSTVSNHPVLRLMEFSITETHECESYWFDGISELRLNEKKYSAHIDNHIKYTNNGFKDITFNEKTCVITETFNGDEVSHQIDFNILLSQYKNDWHYSLLEFKDNLYAAVFKTLNEKYGMMGFSFGLQPSFTINGESDTTNNYIKISLSDAHVDGSVIDFYDSVDYEYLSAKTWDFTADYGGYECIGEGIARYLLKEEMDALENETGNYKALSGYSAQFPHLNIVGEFEETEEFSNIDCKLDRCSILTSFPSSLEFNTVECQTYYVNADTNWSITSSKNHITVSPSSGVADVDYTVEVCNTKVPTSSAETSTLTLEYCNTSTTVNVIVIEDEDACLPQGLKYYISAEENTLTIPTKCCVDNARETTEIGSIINVYSTNISVYVPENNTGLKRIITVLLVYCDGTSTTVTIYQDNVFEEWRNTDIVFCLGFDKYTRQVFYSGNTRETMSATSEVRDIMTEKDSEMCEGTLYRWVDTGESGCTGCDSGGYKMVLETSHGNKYMTPECGFLNADDTYGCPSGDDYGCQSDGKSICLCDDCIEGFINASRTTNECGECVQSIDSLSLGALSTKGNITSVILPETLTFLDENSFSDMYSLRNIALPDGITSIPKYCFYYCSSLETIIIGSNIEYIDYQAFNYCTSLKNFIIHTETPPVLGSNVFAHTPDDLLIFVPRNSVASYKAAPGWMNFGNKIQSIE